MALPLQLKKGGSLTSTSNYLLDSLEMKNNHYQIKIVAGHGLPMRKDDNQKLSMCGPPALHWSKDNVRRVINLVGQALKLAKDDRPT